MIPALQETSSIPDIVFWIWGITLAIAVLVILPLVVYLLNRTLVAAKSIEHYLADMRDAGVGIAGNTGHIKALDNTIGVATQILGTADAIKGHAATIETTLASRTNGGTARK